MNIMLSIYVMTVEGNQMNVLAWQGSAMNKHKQAIGQEFKAPGPAQS